MTKPHDEWGSTDIAQHIRALEGQADIDADQRDQIDRWNRAEALATIGAFAAIALILATFGGLLWMLT